jgi:Flp pilus assembly protein TadG
MRLSLRYRQQSSGGRPAVAAVEMAVLLPVLAAIMLGMFELSRALMVKQTLTDAARKGCRTGIIHQYGNVDITNDVTNVMQDNGFDTTKFNPPSLGSISITVTDPNGNPLADALDAPPGSTVSVQVSIPVSSFTWGTTIFLSGSVLDSDQIVMMKQ